MLRIVTALAVVLALAGAASAHAASSRSDAWIRDTLAANPGSVRVADNQIRLEPGLTLTLHARGAAKAAKAAGKPCHRLYFCIYEDVGFGNASLDMSACRIYNLHSYRFIDQFHRPDRWDNEASSWINHQTGGAVATLWSNAGGKGTFFKAPVSRDSDMGPNWNDNVESVKPC